MLSNKSEDEFSWTRCTQAAALARVMESKVTDELCKKQHQLGDWTTDMRIEEMKKRIRLTQTRKVPDQVSVSRQNKRLTEAQYLPNIRLGESMLTLSLYAARVFVLARQKTIQASIRSVYLVIFDPPIIFVNGCWVQRKRARMTLTGRFASHGITRVCISVYAPFYSKRSIHKVGRNLLQVSPSQFLHTPYVSYISAYWMKIIIFNELRRRFVLICTAEDQRF